MRKQVMFWSSTTRICCCTHEGFTQATYASTATSTLGGMNRSTTPSTMPCASTTPASGHYVSRRDYSSSGLHWLYCAYAVHPDTPSRRSTSRRSVALALAVHPVTASRGATNRRPDCTGSTVPMLCIRTRRLAA
jgi:hypothetical protein